MQPQNTPPQPVTPQTPPAHDPLRTMQPGEQVICEIKRHPINILLTYAIIGFMIVAIAALFVFGLPYFNGLTNYAAIAALLLATLLIIYAYIATKIYYAYRWIVTSDSVTQYQQTGLFSKHSSQLPMGNIEDITVEQHGMFAQMLNYGTIKAQSAGEHSKFLFAYCPNPNVMAQKIIQTKEIYNIRDDER